MKKIAIIAPRLDAAGGLERIVIALANELSERHYAVSLIITYKESSVFYALHPAVKTYHLDADFGIGNASNYFRRKLKFIADSMNLKKILSEIRPTIIISTTYFFTVAVTITGLHKRAKLINWEHNTFLNKRSKVWMFFTKFAYSKADYIVALNEDELSFYRNFNKKAAVIANFVEPSHETSALNSNKILTIARFEDFKGIDLLIQTAALVLDKFQDWKWTFIGAGNLKEQYSDVIKLYGLHQNLFHEKMTTEKVEAYKNASLYVMTSKTEPFGMVLIEAMNHGLPCIAFDCDTGPRHIISHNDDGLLVEKENPSKLAEAIGLLIENNRFRKQLGLRAKQNVARFYKASILEQWEELFDRLLAE